MIDSIRDSIELRLNLALSIAQARRAAEDRARKIAEQAEQEPSKNGRKLGVWINGKLRFQSRDADAIHEYAQRKMRDFRNNVWLAPVGSFVEAD